MHQQTLYGVALVVVEGAIIFDDAPRLPIEQQRKIGRRGERFFGQRQTPGDILLDDKDIELDFWISENELEKWKYLKGSKKETRTTKEGFEYFYTEGPVGFPDSMDKPSKTIITGEGGRSPSRFKHVVKTRTGRFRRLMPIELERLNMFPDNYTKEASPSKRAFFMGNALVVRVDTKLAKTPHTFEKKK